ncbi:hypothetical protein PIB30_035467 [Stylosanthes scabra]|uniref:Uncharacterized protein n=1 Tax=Stylosanthes scabra TaxID=79078 RepID=A0ABU6VDW0_9FABA|nr:hypothetical protein [Stylosanthes scabra]
MLYACGAIVQGKRLRDAIREAWRHKKPIETELPLLLGPLFLVGTIPTSLWYYLNDSVHLPRSDPINVPIKEAVTSTLPPKKRQNYRMAGESSSRRDTRTPCRRLIRSDLGKCTKSYK